MVWIIILIPTLLSFFVSSRFKSVVNKYSKIPNSSGLTGSAVAQAMLQEKGITGVTIVRGKGTLTDHYNPTTKTISLSPTVHDGRSVMSAAVAAHETGHAVQHAVAYSWLKVRSALVPPVSFASKVIPWILIAGIVTVQVFPYLLGFAVLLFALTTLFSFITLPVEYDASKRALAWLQTSNVTIGEEQGMAKTALDWAARTYVVAALASLATLLYYAMIFFGRRN